VWWVDKMKKIGLIIFVLVFLAILIFLNVMKVEATVCCCYPDNNNQCTQCSTYSGNACPDTAVCGYYSGQCSSKTTTTSTTSTTSTSTTSTTSTSTTSTTSTSTTSTTSTSTTSTTSTSTTTTLSNCKTNPWSGKSACCDSATDCVDYYGNCIDSGNWANGNNVQGLDYCYNGEWKGGFCVATDITCLSGCVYTIHTQGCTRYSLVCPPYDYYVVVALGTCGSITPCSSNADCPGYDPVTKLKLVCDQTTGACVPLASCKDNSECAPGYCCDTVTKTYSCNNTPKGTILSSGGKSYLCDPPEGFVEVKEVKYESEKPTKKLSFLDILINFFSHFFNK